MRHLLPLTAFALTLAACQPAADAPAETPAAPITATAGFDTYGAAIADTASALSAEAVAAQAATLNGQPVKLAGTLKNVCQMAGCWATMDTPNGTIRITVPKNEDGTYKWTMPKDIAGRRVVAEGTLKQSTLTADHARHMDEESGTAATDSTQYKDAPELQLEATGVLVEKAG